MTLISYIICPKSDNATIKRFKRLGSVLILYDLLNELIIDFCSLLCVFLQRFVGVSHMVFIKNQVLL